MKKTPPVQLEKQVEQSCGKEREINTTVLKYKYELKGN